MNSICLKPIASLTVHTTSGDGLTEMNVEGEESKWKGEGEAKTGGQQMDINRFSRQYNHKYVTVKGFCSSNDFLFLRKELLLKVLSGEKKVHMKI
jgi:hypothetical protein